MTRSMVRFTLFAFALTMSITAFAASKKSETVTLYQPAQLNGKTLPAGEYTVKYTATGSTAQVQFLRNGKEVASANGQVKQLSTVPENNQVVTQDGSGSTNISEIDFAHSNTGVAFEPATMSSAGSN